MAGVPCGCGKKRRPFPEGPGSRSAPFSDRSGPWFGAGKETRHVRRPDPPAARRGTGTPPSLRPLRTESAAVKSVVPGRGRGGCSGSREFVAGVLGRNGREDGFRRFGPGFSNRNRPPSSGRMGSGSASARKAGRNSMDSPIRVATLGEEDNFFFPVDELDRCRYSVLTVRRSDRFGPRELGLPLTVFFWGASAIVCGRIDDVFALCR